MFNPVAFLRLSEVRSLWPFFSLEWILYVSEFSITEHVHICVKGPAEARFRVWDFSLYWRPIGGLRLFLDFDRVVVSLTHSPFPFSILDYVPCTSGTRHVVDGKCKFGDVSFSDVIIKGKEDKIVLTTFGTYPSSSVNSCNLTNRIKCEKQK